MSRRTTTAACLLAAAFAATPAVAQMTRPTTMPATRPAESSPMLSLLEEAADAYEGLTDEQKAALAAGPAAGAVDLDDARAAVDAFAPLLDRVGELDLDDARRPISRPASTELPRFALGINPLVSAALAGMSPQLTADEDALANAADRLVNAAALLRPVSRGNATSFWFISANADSVLHQTLAGRALRVPPETLERLADLPPLKEFHEVTAEEGRELAEFLRDSDELPEFVVQLAGQKDIGDDELDDWRQDWTDPEQKRRLIEEYELYFDVEVELARLLDEPAAMERFLAEWEAGHDNESLWLSRYTLMSPREAYALQFRQRAIRDLFDVVVAAVGEEGNDLERAINESGTVAGGGAIRAQPANDGRLLLVADVPLGDRPALLPIGE